MPTHNGERYIREALDSLLAQDYPHFELLISDNASTDATPGIIREYADRDPRVRVVRHPANIGAAANFNFVFHETNGPYFMWAADDDRWEPSYVSKCVAMLNGHDAAVMATSRIRFIDEAGLPIEVDFPFDNPDLSALSTASRVRMLLRRGGWYQIYGLARRDALARTSLLQNIYGADVVLTMELALFGPITRVPEVLFWYRRLAGVTEASRVQRQGAIPNAGRVLEAKYTHLEESLTRTVLSSTLPRRAKVVITAEIIRGAYFDDTPLSRHTSSEVSARLRFAIQDRDVGAIGKFLVLLLLTRGARVLRRVSRPAMRRTN